MAMVHKIRAPNNMNDLMDEVYKMIKQRMVDAFILLYSKENDPIKQMLIDESMPFIVIGKPTSDIRSRIIHIDNDNILASENLTRHVIEQGVDEFKYLLQKKEILKFQKIEFKDLKRLHHNLIWIIKLLRLVMKKSYF